MNDKSGLRKGFPDNYFLRAFTKICSMSTEISRTGSQTEVYFANFHALSFMSRKFEVISPIVTEKYRLKFHATFRANLQR